MQTPNSHNHLLIAERDAMWFAGAATFCSVQVATANKVRTAIRPATSGGPAGGFS